jgi:lactate racemase
LPDDAHVVSPGFSLALSGTSDLAATVAGALDSPLDRPPLASLARPGMRVTIAFDDPTVPCYAPVWATALPLIVGRLEGAGVKRSDISLVCANSLHRQFTHDELERTIGAEVVAAHGDRLSCHDAEDEDAMVHLGTTPSGFDVVLGRSVVDSDLTIYLNCSTMRGFSGGWKSVCVGLSGYRSIHHHHTPDIMSMSLDRNRMHEILNEMGALVDSSLGPDRVFKLETVLANPLEVHDMYGGSVLATREAVTSKLRAHQPPRRELVPEPVDIVVYGVPDWSPYAAYSHTNPILDIISTGLGYLGGMIEAVGKPGCTVVLATPCPPRWNMTHHPAYKEVWETVLTETLDPEVARHDYEPSLARRADYIEKYRFANAFHPVHATMALYPLKRLRHASRVIVAGAVDEAVPEHLGFASVPTVEAGISMARAERGPDATVAVIDYPLAFNRQ